MDKNHTGLNRSEALHSSLTRGAGYAGGSPVAGRRPDNRLRSSVRHAKTEMFDKKGNVFRQLKAHSGPEMGGWNQFWF